MKRTALPAVLAGALIIGACGGSEDRPTAAEWRPDWDSTRVLVPTADRLEAGGVDLCGELLGEVRSRREELLPTPSKPTDDAFILWVEQAEALGLDCVDDTEDLDTRLDEITDLADQVDLALSGD